MHYVISGLKVESDIRFPGVAEASPGEGGPDVRVRKGVVRSCSPARQDGSNWFISDGKFQFSIPRIARMQVDSGREIVVECEGKEVDAIPFLLGTAFGILLHQRNSLILHASAVSHQGRAIALCGPSGVGKSTLSAALCQAGCSFISDDVSAVRFENGVPMILSDSRQHRLWHDAIEKLALADRRGEAVRDPIEKYHVEPVSKSDAVPLSKIIVLRQAMFSGRGTSSEPLGLSDAAALLRSDVYRSRLASRMGRDASIFSQIAGLLPHVKVYRLVRPLENEKQDEVVDLLCSIVFRDD